MDVHSVANRCKLKKTKKKMSCLTPVHFLPTGTETEDPLERGQGT